MQVWAHHSWFARPAEVCWQVVVADVTGLPAVGRIVEDASRGMRTIAVVEIPNAADEQDIAGPGATVRWWHTPGLGRGQSRLAELARSIELPDGPGYVYVAGEAAATRAVRRYLRADLALPKGTYGVVGYWRHDTEAFQERLASSGIDAEALWLEAQQVTADEEQAVDLYEQRLDEAGVL